MQTVEIIDSLQTTSMNVAFMFHGYIMTQYSRNLMELIQVFPCC